MLSVLLSGGCTSSHVHKALMDVESYIVERPDSALNVLDSMDRSLLKSDRLRAHHALLHAMALDKNYIDVSDDSLASVALSYYSRKGPEKYLARAQYYLGLSYYYAGDYNKAILEFTKAERIAEDSDSLYLGFLKVAQADTYAKTHNEVEEYDCLMEAQTLFSQISEEYYKSVTDLRLAQVLYNKGEYESCEEMLKSLISNREVNERIRTFAIINLAFSKASSNCSDFSLATELYEKVASEYEGLYMTHKDYWAWAYSYIQLERSSEAQNLIDQLKEIDTSGTADYWMYLIEKSKGNTDKALRLLEKFTNKNNEDITKALQQSLALSQRDYYEAEYQNAEYRAHNRILVAISVGFASVLIMVIVIWGSLTYNRRQRNEKEYYLNYANEIRRQLEASKSDNYPELKRKYLETYKSKFEMIGSLYEEYVLYHGKKNAEQAVYSKVSEIIIEFIGDNSNRKQLESVLDESLDGIVSMFRKEMPKLKELDYSIFSFMIIDFDATTISHLLNVSTNVVYIRKSRMKQHIEEAHPEHKERFLAILD